MSEMGFPLSSCCPGWCQTFFCLADDLELLLPLPPEDLTIYVHSLCQLTVHFSFNTYLSVNSGQVEVLKCERFRISPCFLQLFQRLQHSHPHPQAYYNTNSRPLPMSQVTHTMAFPFLRGRCPF